MTKAVIVYGSTTGNTEIVAHMIADVLEKNYDVKVADVVDIIADDLNEDYDLLVFGASTWGTDEIEMQEDFETFFEDFEDIEVQGKKVAVFGCGDTSYIHYCGAVDVIEQKLKEMGATIVAESLKIDGDPDDAQDEIEAFAAKLAQSV